MEEPNGDFVSDVTTLPGEGGDEETRKRVVQALAKVNDPEIGINIVDLGLVYDLTIEEGTVKVTYTLTTMGCPIGPMIEEQMRGLVDDIDGVKDFEAQMVFSPPWTPEKMSEEAKAALGMF
ncbi:MAG TPA: metal-sulfur cluster assembly factor [Actinomycetota bacterium]|nr:metal-sulfur cluster assembly factor [Actinomycetota bacterium]